MVDSFGDGDGYCGEYLYKVNVVEWEGLEGVRGSGLGEGCEYL